MKEKGEKSILRQNSTEQSGRCRNQDFTEALSAGKAYLLLYQPIQLSLSEEQEVQFPRPGLEQIARLGPGFWERYVFPASALE